MPDLGKYAADVLAAYGLTIVLIISLVGFSLRQSARAKRLLEAEEAKVRNRGR